jgi:prolyl-tRNA synthetase
VVVVRRDTGDKVSLPKDGLKEKVTALLDEIQTSLYQRALRFRQENTQPVDTYSDFKELLEGQGGFLYSHWCGEAQCEDQVKQETKATIRCIPIEVEEDSGACVRCGKPSPQRVYFAKAY